MSIGCRAYLLRTQLRDGAVGSIASGDRLKHWCSIMKTYDELVALNNCSGRLWRKVDSVIIGGPRDY